MKNISSAARWLAPLSLTLTGCTPSDVGSFFGVCLLGAAIYGVCWVQMQSTRYRAEFPVAKGVTEPLDIVKRHLSSIGYRLEEGFSSRMVFVYERGNPVVSNAAQRSHRVEAMFTGSTVVFEVKGVLGTLKPDDETTLRHRFEGVLHSLKEAAPAPELPKAERVVVEAVKAETESVREKTIERQIVVARCKFCSELAPIDLQNCKNCGAAKFA